MTGANPTVALVHAGFHTVAPTAQAFADMFPRARLWNLVDDGLLGDALAAGGVTPALATRVSRLTEHALAGGADAVQLCCSMYGAAVRDTEWPAPVTTSDEPMFDAVVAAEPERVLVIGSLELPAQDSAERLHAHLVASGLQIDVATTVVHSSPPNARPTDPAATMAARLIATIEAGARPGDAVMLGQYSLSAGWAQASASIGFPIFSAPHAAAEALRDRLATVDV